VLVVGGGSFGGILAAELLALETAGALGQLPPSPIADAAGNQANGRGESAHAPHRIVVLEAGPHGLPEHIQNLPVGLGLGFPNFPDELASPAINTPWTGNVNFPGLAFVVGGRSLFWGGWSPELIRFRADPLAGRVGHRVERPSLSRSEAPTRHRHDQRFRVRAAAPEPAQTRNQQLSASFPAPPTVHTRPSAQRSRSRINREIQAVALGRALPLRPLRRRPSEAIPGINGEIQARRSGPSPPAQAFPAEIAVSSSELTGNWTRLNVRFGKEMADECGLRCLTAEGSNKG
jgi:hypothetical protein